MDIDTVNKHGHDTATDMANPKKVGHENITTYVHVSI